MNLITLVRVTICTATMWLAAFAHAGALRFVGAGSDCNYHTIQAAVTSAASGDTLYVTNNPTTYSEHVTIANKSLTILGRTSTSCTLIIGGVQTNATAGTPTVDGGNSGIVFNISGTSTVSISGLTITGGNNGGGDGGGISYNGAGTLTLTNVAVIDNKAGYGAGINFKGNGGHADLRLKDGALVFGNTASTSGGGVRIEGDARLIMVGANASISGNTASDSGFGGGVEILGPARADITGYGLSPIAANGAGKGGGIAVIDNGNGAAVLRTFAYGPTQTPALINGNSATLLGGAIYLEKNAVACLYATRVEGNSAPEGAAFYKNDVGYATTGLFLNGGQSVDLGGECGPEFIASLGGASACPTGSACSTISGNTGAGSTIYNFGSRFTGTRFRMQNNEATDVIFLRAASADLKRCLLTDNHASGALINADYANAGSGEHISTCTIANNNIQGAYLFEMLEQTGIELTYDIIDAQFASVLHHSSAAAYTPVVGYVLASEIATLSSTTNPSVVRGLPYFVDGLHGDYHLWPVAQLALDFATTGGDVDLDGRSANVDLPTIVNNYGPGDLGAFERMNLFDNCGNAFDTLFCNGYEHAF
ncbi:MAG: hypothetical protein ABJB01_05760 [Rudaea sp.]